MSVSTNLVPAAVSAVVGTAMSLKGPVLLVILAVALAGYGVSVLPDVLRYRLHAKAVEKTAAADLPALFRAFSPDGQSPTLPDDAVP